MDRYTKHRKAVTCAIRDLEFPNGLPQIVADYACISDEERLRQMFRITDEVQFINNAERFDILYVRNTTGGITISCTLTPGLMSIMTYDLFIDKMNSGNIYACILKKHDLGVTAI